MDFFGRFARYKKNFSLIHSTNMTSTSKTSSESFESAKAWIDSNKQTLSLSQDDQAKLYGLFKQATSGDNTAAEPWMWQLVEHGKWDAWNKYKGLSKKDAERKYVEQVAKLKRELTK